MEGVTISAGRISGYVSIRNDRFIIDVNKTGFIIIDTKTHDVIHDVDILRNVAESNRKLLELIKNNEKNTESSKEA